MEIEHPADPDAERGHVAPDHRAVEDHRRVRQSPILLDPLHDRVASDLLLAVEREADVDGQLPGGGEAGGRLDEEEQVAFVVGDTAREEVPVPLRELERGGLPELERVRRLDVEVRVAKDGRRLVSMLRRPELPDDERVPVGLDELGLATARHDPVPHPRAGGAHVLGVRRIRAHGRDRDQLRERAEELVV